MLAAERAQGAAAGSACARRSDAIGTAAAGWALALCAPLLGWAGPLAVIAAAVPVFVCCTRLTRRLALTVAGTAVCLSLLAWSVGGTDADRPRALLAAMLLTALGPVHAEVARCSRLWVRLALVGAVLVVAGASRALDGLVAGHGWGIRLLPALRGVSPMPTSLIWVLPTLVLTMLWLGPLLLCVACDVAAGHGWRARGRVPRFARWSVPWPLSLLFVVGVALILAGDVLSSPVLMSAGAGALLFASVPFTLQGAAVVWHWSGARGLEAASRRRLLAAAVVAQFLVPGALTVVGLVDSWQDFRNLAPTV